jgi:hypothetical protein
MNHIHTIIEVSTAKPIKAFSDHEKAVEALKAMAAKEGFYFDPTNVVYKSDWQCDDCSRVYSLESVAVQLNLENTVELFRTMAKSPGGKACYQFHETKQRAAIFVATYNGCCEKFGNGSRAVLEVPQEFTVREMITLATARAADPVPAYFHKRREA